MRLELLLNNIRNRKKEKKYQVNITGKKVRIIIIIIIIIDIKFLSFYCEIYTLKCTQFFSEITLRYIREYLVAMRIQTFQV